MTDLELNRIYELSKDDRHIIVGSEVRQLISMIYETRQQFAEYIERAQTDLLYWKDRAETAEERVEICLETMERMIQQTDELGKIRGIKEP